MQENDVSLDMKKGSRGRTGRKDSSGQEAVFNAEAIQTRADDLVALYNAAQTAANDFSEAVKAVAEKSGTNAASVRKFIVAKAGDDFEGAKAKVLQLALVFEEVEA